MLLVWQLGLLPIPNLNAGRIACQFIRHSYGQAGTVEAPASPAGKNQWAVIDIVRLPSTQHEISERVSHCILLLSSAPAGAAGAVQLEMHLIAAFVPASSAMLQYLPFCPLFWTLNR